MVVFVWTDWCPAVVLPQSDRCPAMVLPWADQFFSSNMIWSLVGMHVKQWCIFKHDKRFSSPSVWSLTDGGCTLLDSQTPPWLVTEPSVHAMRSCKLLFSSMRSLISDSYFACWPFLTVLSGSATLQLPAPTAKGAELTPTLPSAAFFAPSDKPPTK